MRAFYVDENRPLGVNNSVKVVNMPHVLGELQGWQKPVYETTTDSAGHEHQEIVGFELVEPGTLTPAEYDDAIGDLVNFLVYVGEPIQMERKRLGFWVLLYLFVALIVFYLLKKEYWKDVH